MQIWCCNCIDFFHSRSLSFDDDNVILKRDGGLPVASAESRGNLCCDKECGSCFVEPTVRQKCAQILCIVCRAADRLKYSHLFASVSQGEANCDAAWETLTWEFTSSFNKLINLFMKIMIRWKNGNNNNINSNYTFCVRTKDIEFLFYWRNLSVSLTDSLSCSRCSSSSSVEPKWNVLRTWRTSVGSFRFFHKRLLLLPTSTVIVGAQQPPWSCIALPDDDQRRVVRSSDHSKAAIVSWRHPPSYQSGWLTASSAAVAAQLLSPRLRRLLIRQDSLTYYCCFLPSSVSVRRSTFVTSQIHHHCTFHNFMPRRLGSQWVMVGGRAVEEEEEDEMRNRFKGLKWYQCVKGGKEELWNRTTP